METGSKLGLSAHITCTEKLVLNYVEVDDDTEILCQS